MKSVKQTDILTGSIPKQLLLFFLPIWFGTLFQQLYNTADTLIVGNFVGTNALAAVGATGPFVNLLVGLFVGLCSGAGVVIAQSWGAHDPDAVDRQVHTALVLSAAVGALLTVLGLVTAAPIMRLLGTPDEILPDAALYLRIYFLGMIPQMLYNMGTNILRAIGDSKRPLYFLIAASLVNIVLDVVFIAVFGWGVMGAALATVISQAVSAVWVMTFLTGKKTRWHLKRENLHVDAKIVLPCIALGLSPFVMQSTESLIAICFNSSLLRYGGDMAVGTMTVLTSIMQFSNMPLQGLTQGAQPIVSYNFGAKNAQRVRDAYFCLLRACFTYSMAIWLLVELFPRAFILIFNNDPALVEYAAWAVRIYMGCSGIFGIQIACQQTFVALGNAKTSLFLAVWRKIILLIPLIYILPHFFADKAFAVFLAEPVADFGAVALTSFTFYRQFRRSMRELEGAEATGER